MRLLFRLPALISITKENMAGPTFSLRMTWFVLGVNATGMVVGKVGRVVPW